MEAIFGVNRESINDIYYLAALCAVPGLGRRKLAAAIGRLGSAAAVYEAEEKLLVELELFTDTQIANFMRERQAGLPQRLQEFCELGNITLLTIFSEDYPESLKQINDPPLVLYVKGMLPKSNYAVAVVGSRNSTLYGERASHYFSTSLARAGIPIISGGARGIDTAAHSSCLEAGGSTVAVLGCGIDVLYPAENKDLYERIARNGAVITEFAPGMPPLAHNFPARNRIVVGLSQAVLVAEAGRKSGALITAHIAADEGREVYCVPGDIFCGKSLGCHDLIRKGAKAVDTPADILEDMQSWHSIMKSGFAAQELFAYELGSDERKALTQQREAAQKAVLKKREAEAADKRQRLCSLSADAQNIYKLMQKKTLSLDEIIEITGENFMTISVAVLDLQVAGLIEEEGMQCYRRII